MVAAQGLDVLGDLGEFRVGYLGRREHRHLSHRRAGLPRDLTAGVTGQSRRDGAALTIWSMAGGAAVGGE